MSKSATTTWDPHRDDSEERLAELVLYIANRSEFDQRFGATKLNKVLFYADFIAFARFGRPITGATYRRLQHGPVPRILPRIQRVLTSQNRATIKVTDYYGREQKRLIGLDEPDLDMFTAREIALVDEVLEAFRHKSARELSDLTHEYRGWEYAGHGEDIPYSTIFLADEKPVLTVEEEEYGQELARAIS